MLGVKSGNAPWSKSVRDENAKASECACWSQGLLVNRPRRTGERKPKPAQGCIVGANLSVLNLATVKPKTERIFLD